MKYLILFALYAFSSLAAAQEAKPGKLFVVPDPNHPWAAAQLGAAIGDDVTYYEGTLLQALTLAQSGHAGGVLEIKLDTDSAWETGRVVCYAPSGKKIWEEKVFFNFGGGAEGVARKFADKLEKKIAGKHCVQPATT